MKLFSTERRQWRQKFYNSALWRRMSAYQLKKNPLCEICKKQNIITPAVHADHIEAWTTSKEFLSNKLQSLCFNCHREKTVSQDIPDLMLREKLRIELF